MPIDDLVYGESLGRMHPVTRLAAEVEGKKEFACNDDANQHRVLVAVTRATLPNEAFEIWLSDREPPRCCVDTAGMHTDIPEAIQSMCRVRYVRGVPWRA